MGSFVVRNRRLCNQNYPTPRLFQDFTGLKFWIKYKYKNSINTLFKVLFFGYSLDSHTCIFSAYVKVKDKNTYEIRHIQEC